MIGPELVGARIAQGIGLQMVADAQVVAIVGSREWPELHRVRQLVEQLSPTAVVISGGADGVDVAGEDFARQAGHPVVTFDPAGATKGEWTKAAFARNGFLALCADVVVAFWDGTSSGTKDTIRKAMKTGGCCVVVLPGQEPQVWELVP